MTITGYTAKYFSAIAQENRIRILKFLKYGEKCVCEIFPAISIEQSNLSKHLKVLSDAGILESRKDGNSIYYRVKDRIIFDIIELAEKAIHYELKNISKLIDTKIKE